MRQLAAFAQISLVLVLIVDVKVVAFSGPSVPVCSPEEKAILCQDSRRNFVQAATVGIASAFLHTLPSGANELPRYDTAADIPNSVIENHQVLYGYVEKVIDGDTVRVRHIPDVNAFLRASAATDQPKSARVPLANTTIIVRLYGVDAPETAKKQSETSQPFGEDAKQFTKDLTYHKLVGVKLLSRDRYNRIIAEVDTCSGSATTVLMSCPTSPKDLSQELASRGFATMYTGKGAEYDGKRDMLIQNIEAAKRSKMGIWSLGDDLVTPQDYKRMKRAAEGQ